jgi:signal transduction histidine kinase
VPKFWANGQKTGNLAGVWRLLLAPSGPMADRAAKSAIGMAEMLAHEIKNPLAGITGAAQLLSMNLPRKILS